MRLITTSPSLAPVLSFLGGHPSVVPLVLVVLVVAWLVSGPLSRRLRCGRGAAAALVAAVAVPVAMTLSPSADTPGYPLRWCVTAVRPVADWGRGGEELANLGMLAPLGLLAVVLLGRAPALAVLLAASAFPVVVELVQYAVPTLGRTCEATDVLLNLTGLALGALLGLLVLLVCRARRGPDLSTKQSPG